MAAINGDNIVWNALEQTVVGDEKAEQFSCVEKIARGCIRTSAFGIPGFSTSTALFNGRVDALTLRLFASSGTRQPMGILLKAGSMVSYSTLWAWALMETVLGSSQRLPPSEQEVLQPPSHRFRRTALVVTSLAAGAIGGISFGLNSGETDVSRAMGVAGYAGMGAVSVKAFLDTIFDVIEDGNGNRSDVARLIFSTLCMKMARVERRIDSESEVCNARARIVNRLQDNIAILEHSSVNDQNRILSKLISAKKMPGASCKWVKEALQPFASRSSSAPGKIGSTISTITAAGATAIEGVFLSRLFTLFNEESVDETSAQLMTALSLSVVLPTLYGLFGDAFSTMIDVVSSRHTERPLWQCSLGDQVNPMISLPLKSMALLLALFAWGYDPEFAHEADFSPAMQITVGVLAAILVATPSLSACEEVACSFAGQADASPGESSDIFDFKQELVRAMSDLKRFQTLMRRCSSKEFKEFVMQMQGEDDPASSGGRSAPLLSSNFQSVVDTLFSE